MAVLTRELVATVFRVEAHVGRGSDGRIALELVRSLESPRNDPGGR